MKPSSHGRTERFLGWTSSLTPPHQPHLRAVNAPTRISGHQVSVKPRCVYTGAPFSWNTQLFQACVTFKCWAIVWWRAAVVQLTDAGTPRAEFAAAEKSPSESRLNCFHRSALCCILRRPQTAGSITHHALDLGGQLALEDEALDVQRKK